ncbi:MAG: hypothetical protein HETSPECPRED_010220 [Heterodermia speciosa]|uniref:3'-phosphate/5'-hydroxy nucleic acid ligase n=1 Tax=Heterodermia speciosa TaxID=116794 RepID=A0A8H3IA88_9LECA|nr:MAG: hypothetical protein HETSPECPRED_010220 [Heterodermia speciosa]
MPSIRVTLASNAKQSQKAPLIIPSSTSYDPASPVSSRSLVIKAAQSKLRLKKPSRVFIAGGKELISEEDWKAALKDDVVLLISAAEDYVGSRNDESTNTAYGKESSAETNGDCPIEILAEKAFIDDLSIKQLETTACTLPGIIHAVAQPDLHPGTKFPIGAIFVSKGWIHPPLIGGDIGCGMAWYKTALTRSNVEGDKGRKVAEKLRGLEGAWRTQKDREVWLRDDVGSRSYSAGEEWDASLGTIGAGNHFAEIQIVEESSQQDETVDSQYQLHEDEVVILVHSGSRGYGGDILKRYTANSTTSMKEDEPIATKYLEEHDRACNWASRNRDLIALRFLACLEPSDETWELGASTASSSNHTPEELLLQTQLHIQSRKVVDIWHNNVSTTPWPPSAPPAEQYQAYIHRKGAAPTHNPHTSLPLTILPLPGSRATPTLILHPTFSASNAHGLTNALSLAHGAGRAMSRAKAASYIEGKYKGRSEDLLRGDFVRGSKNRGGEKGGGEDVNGGTWVVCEDKQLVWEEAGEAYKDVWAVGEDLVRRGVAERWGWCRGRVSYKVRRE